MDYKWNQKQSQQLQDIQMMREYAESKGKSSWQLTQLEKHDN